MIVMLDTFSEESLTNLHSESAIVLCTLCILSIWCAVNAGLFYCISKNHDDDVKNDIVIVGK